MGWSPGSDGVLTGPDGRTWCAQCSWPNCTKKVFQMSTRTAYDVAVLAAGSGQGSTFLAGNFYSQVIRIDSHRVGMRDITIRNGYVYIRGTDKMARESITSET